MKNVFNIFNSFKHLALVFSSAFNAAFKTCQLRIPGQNYKLPFSIQQHWLFSCVNVTDNTLQIFLFHFHRKVANFSPFLIFNAEI